MTGLRYDPREWPYGLRCPRCDRVLIEGDSYSEILEAFEGDVPVVEIVCTPCVMKEVSKRDDEIHRRPR